MLENRRSQICQGQTRRKAGTQSFRSVGLPSPTIAGPPNRTVGPAAPAGSTSTPLPIHAVAHRRSRAGRCKGCRMYENRISRPRHRWVLAAVLLAMLCGCGDDEEASPPATAPSPGGSSPPRQRSPCADLRRLPPTLATAAPRRSNGRCRRRRPTARRSPISRATASTTARARGVLDKTIEISNPSVSSVRDRRPGAGHVLLRGHGVQFAQSRERALERRARKTRSLLDVRLKPDPQGVEDAPCSCSASGTRSSSRSGTYTAMKQQPAASTPNRPIAAASRTTLASVTDASAAANATLPMSPHLISSRERIS